jgi:hypothetical protein
VITLVHVLSVTFPIFLELNWNAGGWNSSTVLGLQSCWHGKVAYGWLSVGC